MATDDEDVPPLAELQISENPKSTRIPVTILTGPLGSGKSTMIQYILTAKHEKRVAVIVNEFGDTSEIESQAMKVAAEDGAEYEEILELNNGCLCCSIKDRGIAAIERLMDRKGAFDYVLLETTGVADPQPIAQMFWQDDQQLANELYIDAVVCLVDGKNFDKQLEEAQQETDDCAFLQQLLTADLLIINKLDTITDQTARRVTQELDNINAAAERLHATRGVVDLDRVFHRNAYGAGPQKLDRVSMEVPSKSSTHHLSGVSNVVIDLGRVPAYSLDDFDAVFRELLWERCIGTFQLPERAQILRTKGLLQTADGRQYVPVLQGVREVYDIQKLQEISSATSPKLVLIGRHLPKNLESAFLEALAEREEPPN